MRLGAVFNPFFSVARRAFHSTVVPSVIQKYLPYKLSRNLPDKQYFAQLKAEEKRQFGKTSRVRTEYNKNYTAALALPYTSKELATTALNEERLLQLSEEYIIEHANRRIDLLFYTLLAYYNTQFIPTLACTTLQHGIGTNHSDGTSITHACHSSFLPALVDKTIYDNESLGCKNKSLICGLHLMHSLNATVELPKAVNYFDSLLENDFEGRKICLEILGYVALGELNPIAGLSLLLNIMERILKQIKKVLQHSKEINPSRYAFFSKPSLNEQLLDLVARGTLKHTFCQTTRTVSKPYVHSLLYLPVPQDDSPIINEETYNSRLSEIQSELLERTKQRK